MSNKHRKLLQTIYAEPISGNIHWREVESLLRHLGAETISLHGNNLHLKLNRHEGMLHKPHHSSACSKQEVRHLRGFLAAAGVTLASYEGNS
jgi:hypothetical protein